MKNIVDKVKDLEEKRHNKNIQYIAIINMLEIEKAKVLCEYNQNNFDLNLLDINNSLKFSKDKIDLQNELKEKENHVIIEIENKECQKAISENYNIINWLKKDLDIKIKKIEQEYNYNIENSLNELLYKKFNLESKTIIQLLSSFDLILNEIDHTIRTFISIIFNNVIVRPEHLSTINELLSSMYLQIENFYEHSLQSLNEDIKALIKERNEIESEYKFKTNYNQIASDYLDTYNELLLKIDSIDNAIKILNIHI